MQISSGSVTRDCNWSEVSLKGKNVNLMPDIEPGKNVNTPPGKPSHGVSYFGKSARVRFLIEKIYNSEKGKEYSLVNEVCLLKRS